jgi:hypothetical protein
VNLPTLEPGPTPVALTPEALPAPQGPIAASEPAPLVLPQAVVEPAGPAGDGTAGVLQQLLNQLLRLLAATPLRSLDNLLAAGRILALAVLAGIALKLTGATLDAIDEIPLLGGLLELVGLVSLLNLLARNALRQQKRAELLERIRQLRHQLLG